MSKTASLEEIAYRPDGSALFANLLDLPGAAFLDSSQPHCTRGRYDILCAQPAHSPALPAATDGESAWRSCFADLAAYHAEHYGEIHAVSADIPFSGGLLGTLAYDGGNALNRVDGPAPGRYSSGCLRFYDWAVVQDHVLQRAALVCQPQVPAAQREDLLRRLAGAVPEAPGGFGLSGRFRSNYRADTYRAAFDRIRDYIVAGDCYQVNLAQRFEAPCQGDPWQAYRVLRAEAAAPFSAYLALGEGEAMLSLSPERFLSLHGHHVLTSPIKGTRPRHAEPALDEAAARDLRNSAKDRAENLMIVDLLRNDLGHNCVPGTIHVDELFEVQSFPTVHHLVSSISGELAPGRTAFDLLRDCFPGGSITGAPKRRAMQIIAELEPHPREVYCGSVFYISADGRMDSNIAIRSLLCSEGSIRCWGGGGIVADSEWQAEYQETFDKVGRFLEVLEAM